MNLKNIDWNLDADRAVGSEPITEEADETTQETFETAGVVHDEGQDVRGAGSEGSTPAVREEAQDVAPRTKRRVHVEVSPGVWHDKMV